MSHYVQESSWNEAFTSMHGSPISIVTIPACPVAGCIVEEELTVSRRHTRELRDLLVRRSRPGSSPRS